MLRSRCSAATRSSPLLHRPLQENRLGTVVSVIVYHDLRRFLRAARSRRRKRDGKGATAAARQGHGQSTASVGLTEVASICAGHRNAADSVRNAVIVREDEGHTGRGRITHGNEAKIVAAGRYVHWGD